MSNFETTDTEETVTCLHITVYHPSQEDKQVFQALHFCQQQQLKADDLVKFGRDCHVCRFNFVDARVSRIQFALQFFRHFNSSEFGFEIKNLSKRLKLIVDSAELAYLNKVDLPETCMVCFGDYQMLLRTQGGQSENYFAICFELSKTSMLQQKNLSLPKPVPESGILCTAPVEMDETEEMESSIHKGWID
ncbi:TRAF-interacting protein with FHA domain-containing protein A [Rhineura floridana]|uniref:TRAF-interacting protein with FHA domain-containing protein A n=1 Tax=Rhineura floridana TaxID=261503 RepID=UPI002AC7F22A|nr:TRAF-interacting protein with FHA domain-containing protein A [Rhineura floridana]XP_061441356.1 TRAF-interacting protein with FHA domain-containing protein A [Rhineura floridana]